MGAPAIGPPVFMHRASAEVNPTAPLGHHSLDATHVTHGVVTAGVTRGPFTIRGVGVPWPGAGRRSGRDRVRPDRQLRRARLVSPRRLGGADLGGAPEAARSHRVQRSQSVHRVGVVRRHAGRTSAGGDGGVRVHGRAWHGPQDAGRAARRHLASESAARPLHARRTARERRAHAWRISSSGIHASSLLSTIGALTVGYERRIAATRVRAVRRRRGYHRLLSRRESVRRLRRSALGTHLPALSIRHSLGRTRTRRRARGHGEEPGKMTSPQAQRSPSAGSGQANFAAARDRGAALSDRRVGVGPRAPLKKMTEPSGPTWCPMGACAKSGWQQSWCGFRRPARPSLSRRPTWS